MKSSGLPQSHQFIQQQIAAMSPGVLNYAPTATATMQAGAGFGFAGANAAANMYRYPAPQYGGFVPNIVRISFYFSFSLSIFLLLLVV